MSHLVYFLSAQCHHLVTSLCFWPVSVPFGHFHILHYWKIFRILLHFHPYLAYYFYDMKNTQHALPASPCFLLVLTVLSHTYRDRLPHWNFCFSQWSAQSQRWKKPSFTLPTKSLSSVTILFIDSNLHLLALVLCLKTFPSEFFAHTSAGNGFFSFPGSEKHLIFTTFLSFHFNRNNMKSMFLRVLLFLFALLCLRQSLTLELRLPSNLWFSCLSPLSTPCPAQSEPLLKCAPQGC